MGAPRIYDRGSENLNRGRETVYHDRSRTNMEEILRDGPQRTTDPSTGKQGGGGSVAVVLMQLGGPDSLAAVEPFLYNLFSDPDIIDFPFARLARPTLARLIASRRARKVQEHYASIGGKSPLRELTERQAVALEADLRTTLDARVFVAMRYWHPLTHEVIGQIVSQDFREAVILPLYPQYSKTTTGSSLNEWHRRYAAAKKNGLVTRVVKEFYDHPIYLDAVVEKINEGMERFGCASHARAELASPSVLSSGERGANDVHLVFSAHGVPMSVIEAGDPYQAQVEATVKLVMERGGWPNPHVICYQSRVGPGRWLRPSLDETLHQLSAQGAQRLLVVPIAFVSDHVETLSEIGIEARELAGHLGLGQFEVMPALNDSPKFIQALADLVLRELAMKLPDADGIP
jgi:ferrochelatase